MESGLVAPAKRLYIPGWDTSLRVAVIMERPVVRGTCKRKMAENEREGSSERNAMSEAMCRTRYIFTYIHKVVVTGLSLQNEFPYGLA